MPEPTLARRSPSVTVTEASARSKVIVPATGSTAIRSAIPLRYGSSGARTTPRRTSAGCEATIWLPSTTMATIGAPITPLGPACAG